MTRVLILTPSRGQVSLGYRDTFADVKLECHKRGIALEICDDITNGFIDHARNCLLGAAIGSQATHAFWWDSDISFAPELLFELLERPEVMIVRPYPMRQVDWEAVHNRLLERDRMRILSAKELRAASQRWTAQVLYEFGRIVWSEDGKLVKLKQCGFGWVLMRIPELVEIIKAARVPRVPPELDWRNRPVVRMFDLFPGGNDGRTRCEDVAFCERWHFYENIWAAPNGFIRNGEESGRFIDHLETEGLL